MITHLSSVSPSADHSTVPVIRTACLNLLRSLALLLPLAAPLCQAQDSIRMSMASAEAAEERRAAKSTLGYYNLKLGPTLWNFSAGTAVVFSDNITYRENDALADVIFRPELTTRVLWPVSELNSLNLKLGVGYSAYVQHSEFDRFFLVPGSELSFDVYSGDFWINLHDRFSITDNAFQDPTYAGTGDYQSLQNTAGVGVTWDMNKVVVKSGYDHKSYSALNGNLRLTDEQSDIFSLSGSYALYPNVRVGLETGGSLISYSWKTNTSQGTAFDDNATQWSLGPFTEARLSDDMQLRLGVGYTVLDGYASLGPQGTNLINHRTAGPYGQVSLSHRLTRYLTYYLTGGRNVTFSSYSGGIDSYYASLTANWSVLHNYSVVTSFDYQHGTEFLFSAEDYDWWGPRVTLSRPITRKLTGALTYRYYWRQSKTLPGFTNTGANGFTANVVSLNLEYRF